MEKQKTDGNVTPTPGGQWFSQDGNTLIWTSPNGSMLPSARNAALRVDSYFRSMVEMVEDGSWKAVQTERTKTQPVFSEFDNTAQRLIDQFEHSKEMTLGCESG